LVISKGVTGLKRSKETKRKISLSKIGKKMSKLSSELKSKATKGVAKEKVKCPHCDKVGGKPTMIQWHFDNCKLKGNIC